MNVLLCVYALTMTTTRITREAACSESQLSDVKACDYLLGLLTCNRMMSKIGYNWDTERRTPRETVIASLLQVYQLSCPDRWSEWQLVARTTVQILFLTNFKTFISQRTNLKIFIRQSQTRQPSFKKKRIHQWMWQHSWIFKKKQHSWI